MGRLQVSEIMHKAYKTLVLMAITIVLALVLVAVFSWKTDAVELAVDEKIGNTPVTVEQLRQIGQWEFLVVSDEELVDTVDKHLFRTDEMIRIYYGQLRLGIDMAELTADAFKQNGDTLEILLPPVKLLDENFIDEARTKTFYESGKWSGEDMEKMYEKARRQMKARCLTEDNIQMAKDNAVNSMKTMLSALGVEKYIVNSR